MVQLAAVRSEADALAEWQRLSRHHPDLLGGRQPQISKVEHNGKTFWRLRTSGFADASQASAFCDHLRASGGGCTVASF